MIDKLLAVLETKKPTVVALIGAILLLFTDAEVAVALTNDMGIPANVSLKLVAYAKFTTTVLAAAGLSITPKRTPKDE